MVFYSCAFFVCNCKFNRILIVKFLQYIAKIRNYLYIKPVLSVSLEFLYRKRNFLSLMYTIYSWYALIKLNSIIFHTSHTHMTIHKYKILNMSCLPFHTCFLLIHNFIVCVKSENKFYLTHVSNINGIKLLTLLIEIELQI